MAEITYSNFSAPTLGNVGILSVKWMERIQGSEINIRVECRGQSLVLNGMLLLDPPPGVWGTIFLPGNRWPRQWPLDVLEQVAYLLPDKSGPDFLS